MPISNFGQKHPNIDDQQKIDDGLALIEAVLLQLSTNLSDEERQRFGSINEQNKLFANKIMDYALVSPNLRSPDVDWVAFEADYNTRKFADTRLLRLENIAKMMSNLKIVHDYDNYQDSLTDYRYTQYKSGTNTPGFTEKAKEISQFFARTGITKKDETID
jgi:hypothetical protein